MFLFAWFSAKGPFEGTSGLDAFDAFKDWVNIILVGAAFSGMALALVGSGRVNLPVSLSALAAGLGGLSVILIIVYLISPPGPPFGAPGDFGRKIGAWFGLISAALVAFGGWQAMQAEGTSFGAQAERTRERFDREEPPSAPPPPAPPGEPRV
jgi:hypothetical protein